MRTLAVLIVMLSFSAFAQTRVKENIKQQSVATTADGLSEVVKKPQNVVKPIRGNTKGR